MLKLPINLLQPLARFGQFPNIIAVTPFVLDYADPPFDIFSLMDGQQPTVIYDRIALLPKIKGEPKQVNKIDVNTIFPAIAEAGSVLGIKITIKNIGQKDISSDDINISINADSNLSFSVEEFDVIHKNQSKDVWISLDVPTGLEGLSNFQTNVRLPESDTDNKENFTLNIIKPTIFKRTIQFFLNIWENSQPSDSTLYIYA